MYKVTIVMPAYYAQQTLEKTVKCLPLVYDEIVLCDDGSQDRTAYISRKLGITTLRHDHNYGYGRNQKTLYNYALKKNPDVVIMVHPDNQYDTACLPKMIDLIQNRGVDFVIGSRIKSAKQYGMPIWKYMSNRVLTMIQNLVYSTKLSEFHSGLRAFRSETLRKIPYNKFSDDFVFDSEIIAWILAHRFSIAETDTICNYHKESSSINFRRSLKYGIETLKVLNNYHKGIYHKITITKD